MRKNYLLCPHGVLSGVLAVTKQHWKETLEPEWKRLHIVILSLPMAVKVDGVPARIHHSHMKPGDPHAHPEDLFLSQTLNTHANCIHVWWSLRDFFKILTVSMLGYVSFTGSGLRAKVYFLGSGLGSDCVSVILVSGPNCFFH